MVETLISAACLIGLISLFAFAVLKEQSKNEWKTSTMRNGKCQNCGTTYNLFWSDEWKQWMSPDKTCHNCQNPIS